MPRAEPIASVAVKDRRNSQDTIQPESDPGDNDSAIGDELPDDTTTIASSIWHHREELGRTYHRYHADNSYWGPNDEKQNNQLDIGHHMLTLLLDNKLCLAPIENPQRVIDLGCGTGIWPIDYADAHPETEVIGIDLSPTQPQLVPPNLQFMVDDITDPWTFETDHFDLVNLRCLFGSISDWPSLYRQIFEHTKPGGWVHQLEMSIEFRSDDGTVAGDHMLCDWSKRFVDFGEAAGKTFKIADKCGELIRQAGFEDVQERSWKLPVGTWPKDKRLKELGLFNLHYCLEGCEGWALYILVKAMGWSPEAAQMYIAQFRKEIRTRSNHTYYNVVAVWGRKPTNR